MLSLRVLVFSLLITSSFGQIKDYEFYPVTTAMGLPNKTVSSIIQDKDGFIWFATLDGVCRYDGYSFKVFQREPSDSTSLSHNRVLCMTEDSKGQVWMGTEGGGACKFDPITEKFEQHQYAEGKKGICGPEILAIAEDHEGNIWFGSRNHGACKLNTTTKEYIYYEHDPKDSLQTIGPGSIWNIFQDSKGNIWFSTWGIGYSILELKTGKFDFITPTTTPSIQSVYSGVIYEDENEKLWMTNWGGGLDMYDPATKKITNYSHVEGDPASLLSNETWAISKDNLGDIWVGSYNGGLSRLDVETKQFENFSPSTSGLAHESTWSLLIDRSNVMWVGHDGGDVSKIIRNEKKFQHYTHDVNDPNSLGLALVRCIFEDSQHNIWVGDWGGTINLMNEEEGTFTRVHWPEERRKDKISYIYEISPDSFLVGTYRGGLNIFNPIKGSYGTQYIPKDEDPKSLSHLYVFDIEKDAQGTLWVATAHGLNKFDKVSGTFTRFFHDKDNLESISDNEIKTLFLDSKGGFWVGTENGLNLYSYDSETFTNFYRDTSIEHTLPHSTITAICESVHGELWIGTRNGIAKYNREEQNFNPYKLSIKSKKNDVKGMLSDKEGNIWISTADGLVKFIIETGEFIYYDSEKEGIQGTDFELGACLKASDGKLYFGGTNGFNAFFSEEIVDNKYIPPIVITGFKVNNEEYVLKKAVHKTEEVNLEYNQNNLSFEFAALNFVIPEKNRYRYRLEGFEENWVDAGTKHYADYTNLDPGEYTFRVLGSNNDKRWNEEGTSIKVIIHPPFWQTTIFYVFQSMFFVTLLGFSVYYNRSNKHNRTAKTLAFLSLFMIFEYVFVLLEPTVDAFSQGAAFFKVLMNLVLALCMIPIEKLVEKQYTKKEEAT